MSIHEVNGIITITTTILKIARKAVATTWQTTVAIYKIACPPYMQPGNNPR